VIQLRYIDEHDFATIAQHLGLPSTGAARKRFYRAVEALTEWVEAVKQEGLRPPGGPSHGP
jgi:hypothetical protein